MTTDNELQDIKYEVCHNYLFIMQYTRRLPPGGSNLYIIIIGVRLSALQHCTVLYYIIIIFFFNLLLLKFYYISLYFIIIIIIIIIYFIIFSSSVIINLESILLLL
jgi:hypothetical protein